MFHDIYMTFLWFCVSYFIYMFNRCYIDEFIQYVRFLLIHLIIINCFFSFFLFLHPEKVYETSNLSCNAFLQHFVFENNLTFNMIRLTFLASESLELIQKTLHLKDISFPQLLISTKRYLWNFFPAILFTGSI